MLADEWASEGRDPRHARASESDVRRRAAVATPSSTLRLEEERHTLEQRLEDEQQHSARLAEAAQGLHARARATRSLLTLELVHADDELCAALTMSSLDRRKVEQARVAESRLLRLLEIAEDDEARSMCERAAILGAELAAVEGTMMSMRSDMRDAEQRHQAAGAADAQQLEELQAEVADVRAELNREVRVAEARDEEHSVRVRTLESQLAEGRAALRVAAEREATLRTEVDEVRHLLRPAASSAAERPVDLT